AEAEGADDFANLEIGEAEGGIDDDLGDLFGRLVSDGFDLHAALGGRDDDRSGGDAIEENGEVVFLFDVARLGEVDRLHLAPDGTGLYGDESVAQHLAGEVRGLGLRRAELHAAPK